MTSNASHSFQFIAIRGFCVHFFSVYFHVLRPLSCCVPGLFPVMFPNMHDPKINNNIFSRENWENIVNKRDPQPHRSKFSSRRELASIEISVKVNRVASICAGTFGFFEMEYDDNRNENLTVVLV